MLYTPDPAPKFSTARRRQILTSLLESGQPKPEISPTKPKLVSKLMSLFDAILLRLNGLRSKETTNPHIPNTDMAATWVFSSRDGSEYIELDNGMNMARRYFKNREGAPTTSPPTSNNREPSVVQVKIEWIEMKELRGSTSTDSFEEMDLDEFDICKPRESEEGGQPKKGSGLWSSIRSGVKVVDSILAVGRC